MDQVLMISDLAWIRRGVAKARPDKVKLDDQQMKELIFGGVPESTDVDGSDDSDSEINTKKPGLRGSAKHMEVDDNEESIEKYVECYDDETEDSDKGMRGIAMYTTNKDDPYVTEHVNSDEEEEKDEYEIKPDDNIVAVAKIHKDEFTMEVYVFNEASNDWYCHHDYILDAPPLCLEPIQHDPGNDDTGKGNLIAVGTMESMINIWDLDIMNAVEPVVTLGSKPVKRKKRDASQQGHTDAVISLAWNKNTTHVLASGGADKKIVLWDLDQAKPAQLIAGRGGEVQSIAWHPFESTYIIAGMMSGDAQVVDCREIGGSLCAAWKFDAQVEKVHWNHFNPFGAFLATDDGMLRHVDMRNSGKVLWEGKAHEESIGGLSLSSITTGLLTTVGLDHMFCIWKVHEDGSITKVHSEKLHIGALHAAQFNPDVATVCAIGGSAEDLIKMADILGVVAIIFFYILILVVGIWAGRKSKDAKDLINQEGAHTEEVMLAGRNIGTLVGIFTMTATWVGGAYINGTAEALYNGGLLGCQAPVGYALSLVVGGILFAKKMREEGYVTMLDPFQIKYGQRVGGLMFLPALLGEVFWSAAILSALGATLSVILQIDMNASVIISALIAVFYTFTGGLYAVAYTDVVQLFCIFVGLWVCVPAALLQDKTKDISRNAEDWIGTIGDFKDTSRWIDCMLLLIFGGIPWQVYFQRVLSSRTSSGAQCLSFVAGVGCIVMAIPPALIGAIARNTDWRLTDYSPWNNGTKVEAIPEDKRNMVVPLVFQYLTPKWVAFIGLGAVSAAVMSSADSSVLSAASMFAHNIWKLTIRPHASEKEVILVMRFAIIAVGIMATMMALTIQSIYGLWYLCADLVYVILFPQLVCVVYMKNSNTYGSLAGYGVGLLLRLSGGEPLLNFPPTIHFPMFENETQYFPFRTTAMLSSLTCIYFVSRLSIYLFESGYLSPEWDAMGCVVVPPERIPLPSDISFNVSSDTLAMHKSNENGTHNNPAFSETTSLHPYSDQNYLSTNTH